MVDMMESITPKSSQLNFDDFIGKTLTIKITKVSKVSGEQPISINYEGDNGKPWKPCKSMCRVLVYNWGGDGNGYVGRSLTLYGDPTVKWGGLEVGGIRISHMSDIPHERVMALTTSKSNRKPFTVKPLVVEAAPDAEVIKELQLKASEAASKGSASLDEFLKALPKDEKKHLVHFGKEIRAQAVEADTKLTQTQGE